MKVSISLPEEDVAFLDAYAETQGIPSRSAAIHRAVRLLRATGLGSSYEEAWDEWEKSEESAAWEVATTDGVN